MKALALVFLLLGAAACGAVSEEELTQQSNLSDTTDDDSDFAGRYLLRDSDCLFTLGEFAIEQDGLLATVIVIDEGDIREYQIGDEIEGIVLPVPVNFDGDMVHTLTLETFERTGTISAESEIDGMTVLEGDLVLTGYNDEETACHSVYQREIE